MPVASETDLTLLREQYDIRTIPDLPTSFHRALFAACKIYDVEFIRNPDALFPRLYYVAMPNRNDGEVYLVHNGKSFSRGITDLNGSNPEFEIEQLQSVGVDKTLTVLGNVLEVLDNRVEDQYQFGQVADLLPWGRQGLLMLLTGATSRMIERNTQQN